MALYIIAQGRPLCDIASAAMRILREVNLTRDGRCEFADSDAMIRQVTIGTRTAILWRKQSGKAKGITLT